MEGNRIQVIPVEDTAKMFVRSESGVMGSIDLSWSVNKELPYYLSIYGREGPFSSAGGNKIPPRRRPRLDGVHRGMTRFRHSVVNWTTSCVPFADRNQRGLRSTTPSLPWK